MFEIYYSRSFPNYQKTFILKCIAGVPYKQMVDESLVKNTEEADISRSDFAETHS